MRKLRSLILLLLLGFLLQSGLGHAAILSAELRVNGLSCPFCAFGIEKKLLDVEGVRDVDVFLDEGRITLSFEEDSEATVADLEKAVEKAGFEVAGLRLRAGGTLMAKGGGVRFEASPAMIFRLFEVHAGVPGPVSAGTLERLREARASGSRALVIEGEVEERGDTEPKLILDGTRVDQGSAE